MDLKRRPGQTNTGAVKEHSTNELEQNQSLNSSWWGDTLRMYSQKGCRWADKQNAPDVHRNDAKRRLMAVRVNCLWAGGGKRVGLRLRLTSSERARHLITLILSARGTHWQYRNFPARPL